MATCKGMSFGDPEMRHGLSKLKKMFFLIPLKNGTLRKWLSKLK
jgi:hypothetical protein